MLENIYNINQYNIIYVIIRYTSLLMRANVFSRSAIPLGELVRQICDITSRKPRNE